MASAPNDAWEGIVSDSAPSADQIVQSIAAGAVGFGVLAVVLPRVFNAVYGLGSDPRMVGMTRLWGTRTAALGALGLVLKGDEQRKTLLTLVTAVNATDATLTALNGDLPARTRVLGSASSAAFGAAGAYALATG